MSTSFKVLPGSESLPSFRELIDLSTIRLRQFLHKFGIQAEARINLVLHSKDVVRRVDLRGPVKWDKGWNAWFSVPPVEGGTDMQMVEVEDGTEQLWEEEAKYNQRIAARRELILSCLSHGYYWVLSRTMGQSATINLTYGLIAASLAELTKGIIHTHDGAWEPERFPASAEEFDMWYFRPGLARDPAYRDWAERCIKGIPGELAV